MTYKPITPASPGPERLANESARAYQAFCIYRDLGPSRSIDQAWRSRRSSSKGGSARRPGHWAAWSQKYKWVERAEAYDDSIDEARRIATADRRRQLLDQRSRFELEEQQRIENRARGADLLIEKMLAGPLTEVTQVTRDEITGKKTTTKIRAINPQGIASLMKARDRTGVQAIRGAYDIKDAEREEVKAQRIVWIENRIIIRPYRMTSNPAAGDVNASLTWTRI